MRRQPSALMQSASSSPSVSPSKQGGVRFEEADPSEEDVAIFCREIGIRENENTAFGWIARYGLQHDTLGQRWRIRKDADTGKLIYLDSLSHSSRMDNPHATSLRAVVGIARTFCRQPTQRFLEDSKERLWQQHKDDLQNWCGPMTDDHGRQYFANKATGDSSLSDPRQDEQYNFEIECALLDTLSQAFGMEMSAPSMISAPAPHYPPPQSRLSLAPGRLSLAPGRLSLALPPGPPPGILAPSPSPLVPPGATPRQEDETSVTGSLSSRDQNVSVPSGRTSTYGQIKNVASAHKAEVEDQRARLSKKAQRRSGRLTPLSHEGSQDTGRSHKSLPTDTASGFGERASAESSNFAAHSSLAIPNNGPIKRSTTANSQTSGSLWAPTDSLWRSDATPLPSARLMEGEEPVVLSARGNKQLFPSNEETHQTSDTERKTTHIDVQLQQAAQQLQERVISDENENHEASLLPSEKKMEWDSEFSHQQSDMEKAMSLKWESESSKKGFAQGVPNISVDSEEEEEGDECPSPLSPLRKDARERRERPTTPLRHKQTAKLEVRRTTKVDDIAVPTEEQEQKQLTKEYTISVYTEKSPSSTARSSLAEGIEKTSQEATSHISTHKQSSEKDAQVDDMPKLGEATTDQQDNIIDAKHQEAVPNIIAGSESVISGKTASAQKHQPELATVAIAISSDDQLLDSARSQRSARSHASTRSADDIAEAEWAAVAKRRSARPATAALHESFRTQNSNDSNDELLQAVRRKARPATTTLSRAVAAKQSSDSNDTTPTRIAPVASFKDLFAARKAEMQQTSPHTSNPPSVRGTLSEEGTTASEVSPAASENSSVAAGSAMQALRQVRAAPKPSNRPGSAPNARLVGAGKTSSATGKSFKDLLKDAQLARQQVKS